MAAATQRVKVNLSGLTIKGVTFSQNVMKPLLLPPMLLSGPHALQHAVSPMQNRCGGSFRDCCPLLLRDLTPLAQTAGATVLVGTLTPGHTPPTGRAEARSG